MAPCQSIHNILLLLSVALSLAAAFHIYIFSYCTYTSLATASGRKSAAYICIYWYIGMYVCKYTYFMNIGVCACIL